MIPVDQTAFHDPTAGTRGNCMQAAVASILGLPLGAVPNFVELDKPPGKGRGNLAFLAHLESLGFEVVRFDREMVFDGYYLAYGPSPRGVSHMVVYRDGHLAHDPHPSRAGLLKVDGVYILVPHEPARLLRTG